MTKIKTTDTLELIGVDEQVAQNDWGEAVPFTLRPEDIDGKVMSFVMTSRLLTTGGTGTILLPSGLLTVFSADPGITVGDAALGVDVGETILGTVAIATGDWTAQAAGAWLNKQDLFIPFFPLKILYFAFFWTLAGTINSATDDDEIIEINAHIETTEIL